MTGVLRMSKFGRMGRWGNQVFQYAFLKSYALRNNLTVEIPAWIGEELYGFRDNPIGSKSLERVVEKGEHQIEDTIIPHLRMPLRNVDVEGWFQYHTSYYKPNQAYLMELFSEPSLPVLQRLTPIATRLREQGEDVIGLHFRRGDYGRNMFYITPVDWYVDWLKINYERYDKPVVFVATETLAILDELKAKFPQANYQTCETLGLDLKTKPLLHYNYLAKDKRDADPRQLDFFPDWFLLQSVCDAMLMPNSTFSFSAAWLSPFNKELWRSAPWLERFELIDPWNAYPAQFLKQKDFEHIPGLYLKTNPYWKD